MTFKDVLCCAAHWDNFHDVWTRSSYPFLTYKVFIADTLSHVVTLTFDPLIDLERILYGCHMIKLCTHFCQIEHSAVQL